GRAVLVNPAAGEGAGPPDAQLAHLAAELGAASLMAAPLELGGGAKGALVVGRFDPGRRPFSVDDLAFLREIAERVGVVLAAARLRQDEHDVAVRLQRALLPDELMWRPNVVVEARYDAASELLEVGGDWYDTYSWPDGRIGVLVGDVVGHNLESAAAMGRLRAATAALAKSIEPSPSALLEALDRTARGKDGTSFATAVCVIVDPVTGRLDYSSAGHPPVLVLSPGRSPRRLEDAPSPPLCAVELRPRPEASVQLEPGSLVVLYSDGLIERRRERLDVGLERLERAGERLADLPTSAFVDRLVEAMAAGSPSEDDVVVAAFRYTPVVGVFERTIRPDAGELAVLRGELRAWLEASGLAAATRRRVLLAVGEACTNAVEHAYREGARGPISVELTDHRYHVVARIRDRGNWLLPRNANPYRGKGTGIMQDLSDRFVRRVGFDGTEVTLLLPADPPLERALAAAR
ncbi:MAG: SpoIIE family protein phosphatase, partial [Acidimicrobiales bacterium]